MKLTSKLRMVLLEGPKFSGTYSYPDALGPFEEALTVQEAEVAEQFLSWVVKHSRTYGHGNIEAAWKEFGGEA